MKIPNELYTQKSLYTLGGASVGVVLITGVSLYIFDFSPRWLGLAFAMLLAFVGLFQSNNSTGARTPITVAMFFVALFNGALIFVSATGINTIHHSYQPLGSAKRAAIIPFIDPIAWFAPAELVEMQMVARRSIAALSGAIGQNQAAASDIEKLQQSFSSRRQSLEGRLNGLDKDVRELEALLTRVDPREREAIVTRLSALRRTREDTTRAVEQARIAERAIAEAIVADRETSDPIFPSIASRLRTLQRTLENTVASLRAAEQPAARTLGRSEDRR